MMQQCACPTEAERHVLGSAARPERIAAMTRSTALDFFSRAGYWPNAAEFIATLVVEFAEFGMTWDEGAHWIVRAQTEDTTACGGPGIYRTDDGRYRAVATAPNPR